MHRLTVFSAALLLSACATGATDSVSDGGAFWVYQNGIFNWGGDYSFGGLVPNYHDKTGEPPTGKYDISVTLNGQWGGWLPYAGNVVPQWNMDVSKYTKLTFMLKPTLPNQEWQVYFVKVNDVTLPDSCVVTGITPDYGPNPVVGSWATYTIPLSRMCIGPGLAGGTHIYKFAIQDHTGLAKNLWYIANVAFLP